MNVLKSTFFPTHDENRLRSEGDVTSAREDFLKHRPANLEYLLESRYTWMNEYLGEKRKVVELGAGSGLSRQFIETKNLILTDINKAPWIDEEVDALNVPYADSSVDVVIASHMIHHLAHPKPFFRQMHRILKPGGLMLISEIQTSLLMRLLLWVTRHEGWSYDVDIFDDKAVANDPRDPWSANCAIPDLLFKDSKKFMDRIPGFAVERNDLCEVLIFPLSGGVIARTRTINMPRPVLNLIAALDRLLIRLSPNVFALGRRVVLRKV